MTQIQEIALNMSKSANNLYRLLENLLHWSSMQQGVIHFNPETIKLLPVVDESIAMILEPAKVKGIEIHCNIPDDVVVFADTNLLQTVIRNLVSNAIKFTRKGGKVNLSAKATSDSNIEISVHDTGIGMSQKLLGDLFKLDVKTSRKGTNGEPSTGLGLLLCNEFIEKHGGQIWAESEVGKGSTFYFTLPGRSL
jgi:signal transduction histidine kinase